MSTLLLIPWIIFGYRHPHYRFIGLCHTRRSILLLLGIEIIYWLALAFFLTGSGSPNAGEGSFALTYIPFYEKGIIPLWWLSEKIEPGLANKIDADYKVLYLLAAVIMDYIFLFIISPRVPQLFRKRREAVGNRP